MNSISVLPYSAAQLGCRCSNSSSMSSQLMGPCPPTGEHSQGTWQDPGSPRHPDLIELEALQQLQELCDSSSAIDDQQLVPKLFEPEPAQNSIRALVQQQAIIRKLQTQAEQCLNDDELRLLGSLLQEHATVVCLPAADGGADAEELRINYDGFNSAGRKALAHPDISTAAVMPFTQPGLFLRFERDAAGCISLSLLLHFISLQTSALRLRLQLSVFDEGNRGYLQQAQLHRFLEAMVPTAPMLQNIEPSFLPHYVQIASRKLLLFHGRRNLCVKAPGRAAAGGGRSSSSSSDLIIRLSDLVNSPVMAELQELLMLGPGAEQERDLFSNWFSLQSTQRVLATFTAWDLDGNGTLSKSEFSAISQGAMSELFISRVFEEHVAPRRGATWPPTKQHKPAAGGSDGSASPSSPTRRPSSLPAIPGTSPPRSPASRPLAGTNSSLSRQQQQQQGSGASSWPPPLPPGAACARDEMDLLSFATFVLAWDHRNQPAAIPYFFKIFDINHRGYLTMADLYTFFREVHALWVNMGEYAELEIYDVLDEVMDMVKPATPGRITKADLEACKMSGTVFSILSNVDQFYQYNFRENFMHQEGDDA